MPLSIAHPAAVVPLRRSGLPFSALVVGSMAPDMEYLFHLAPTGHFGHTIPGLFLFCIPIGLITLLMAHRIWAPPANALIGRAPSEFRFLPLERLGLVCLAILIGASSHVAWDSFTHPYGWTVQRVPLLRMPISETAWGTLRVSKLLQHASTVLGLAVMGAVVFPALRTLSADGWKLLAVLSGTSAAGGLAIGLLKAGPPSDFEKTRILVGVSVVGSFVVFIAAATGIAVVWRARGRGNF